MHDTAIDRKALVLAVHAFGGNPRKFWYPWLKRSLVEASKCDKLEVDLLEMTEPWRPRIHAWVDDLTKRVESAAAEAAETKCECDVFLVGHSVGCQTIVRFLAQSCASELLCSGWLRLRGCLCVAAWLSAPSPAVDEPWESIEPWCTTPIDCAAAQRVLLRCHEREAGAKRQPMVRVLLSDNDRYTPNFKENGAAWCERLGGVSSTGAHSIQLVDVQVVTGRAHFGSKKQPEVLMAALSMLRGEGLMVPADSSLLIGDEIAVAQSYFALRVARDEAKSVLDILPSKPADISLKSAGKMVRTRRAKAKSKATIPNLERRGYNSLMTAIAQGNVEEAKRLIIEGDGVDHRTVRGWTPLMISCMHKNAELAELLLCNGAVSTIPTRSTSQLSAADYAQLNGLKAMALRLQELESASAASSLRCPICGEVLKAKTKLQYLRETVSAGTEVNSLVKKFFASKASTEMEKPEYHRLSSQTRLRKEITETMAVVNVLEAIVRRERAARLASGCSQPEVRLHIIDLCCGKSLTGVTLSLSHPEFVVHTVDKISYASLPHYPNDTGNRDEDREGSGAKAGLRYLQRDVFDASFVSTMDTLISRTGLPTVVLGMHLCGNLSIRAIQMLHATALVTDLVLSPCCLPNQRDASSSASWYASPLPDQQYARWVDHLRSCIEPYESRVERNSHILSTKSALIHAHKLEHKHQHPSPLLTLDGTAGGTPINSRTATTNAERKDKAAAPVPQQASWSVHACRLSVRLPSEASDTASDTYEYTTVRDTANDLKSRSFTVGEADTMVLEVPLSAIQAGGKIHIDALLVNRGSVAGSRKVRGFLSRMEGRTGVNTTPQLKMRGGRMKRDVGRGGECASGHPIFYSNAKDVLPTEPVPLAFDISTKQLHKMTNQLDLKKAAALPAEAYIVDGETHVKRRGRSDNDWEALLGGWVIHLSDSDDVMQVVLR
jgi:predicted alpha/beta hydrolase family esterase